MDEGRLAGSYEALEMPSCISLDEVVESSHSNSDIRITEKMVKVPTRNESLMSMNAPTPAISMCNDPISSLSMQTINIECSEHGDGITTPQLMIVYAGGDFNSALYFLLDSINDPFGPNAISTLLVEECIRDEFVERLQDKLYELDLETYTHPHYQSTLKMLDKLNVKIITKPQANAPQGFITPIIVCNLPQSELGPGTSGVLTLHTFTDNRQVVEIIKNEAQAFVSISMWNESVEKLYQVVLALKVCNTFFFNCTNICLGPVTRYVQKKQNAAIVEDGYHYETMLIGDDLKTIVFPVGVLAFNPVEIQEVQIEPISFLNE